MPLIENIKFCKIATQIQDILAQSPLLRTEDRANLDSQLLTWYDSLPWILRSTDSCPESLSTARCVLKWTYQNLRLVLYRPVLLNLANRGRQGGLPSPDELAAVSKCRAIAKQTIEDIAQEVTPNQMLGWHGVWFIYQASMIPLVSMFWESWNTQLVHECQSQLEVVLDALEGMADWSLAARRSREVVSKMYEASKSPPARQPSPRLAPVVMSGVNVITNGVHALSGISGMTGHVQAYEGQDPPRVEFVGEEGMILLDHQNIWDLDGMLWSNLPDGLEMPFDGMPNVEFEDGSGMAFQGGYMMHQ
jgi:hypothetical protein